MSKKDDIDDLLGDDKPVTKRTKKVAEPKVEPVAEVTKPKKADPIEDEPKAKKEPITFEEGERQTIYDGVVAHFKRSKKPINSKDLATKLETETRKLRVVLYSLQKKELITLEPGSSKVAGMTVSPA